MAATPLKFRPVSFALGIVIVILAGLTIVALIAMTVIKLPSNAATPHHEALPAVTATPSATSAPTVTTCDPAYVQTDISHASDRVDAEFAQKYAEATAQANNISDAQIGLILDESGKNAVVLAAWTHAVGLYSDPNNWQPLVTGSCLSSEGQKLHDQLEGALKAKGTTVQEGEAPSNGYNSGINGTTYGVNSAQGVTGDRKAIQITLPNGKTVWIMVRCGNPVFPGKPNLPTVTTDNPPPTTHTPTCEESGTCKTTHTPTCQESGTCTVQSCPPGQHGTYPVCKDDPSNDPAPKGNAPVGGGKNADPGPGTYVPPSQVQQPPATAYTPPPAPVATPAPSTSSNPQPTPDPAPAPAPEPSAPSPTAPAEGCSPAPGMTTC